MDKKEKQLLIELLNKVDPKKPYGTELFDALTRITVSVAIEMVCLRHIGEGSVVVYLTQRSLDNTAYPGEWHCPGSFIRPGEKIEDVFTRIIQKEIKAELFSARFIADVNHPTEARGHVISKVYLCSLQLVDNMRDWHDFPGQFFPVDKLPEKTVESHRKRIIPATLGAFLADCTDICT